jgi:hypothetical protein
MFLRHYFLYGGDILVTNGKAPALTLEPAHKDMQTYICYKRIYMLKTHIYMLKTHIYMHI